MRRAKVLQKHTRIGDPHVTSDDSDRLSILSAVVEPLVRRKSGGMYQPCLASHWDLSDDARKWTFHLRSDVVFHDGSPFTAEDVAASLFRICNGNVGGELGTQGVYQSYLQGSHIVVAQSDRLTLETPEPTADLLDLLTDIPILPSHTLEHIPESIIGTGPYRFDEQSNNRVVLTRYHQYWAPADRIDEVEWVAVPDTHERLDQLLAGKADIATPIPSNEVGRIEGHKSLHIVKIQTSVCAAFMCNLLDGPCTRAEVRQALNYALNVPELIHDVMDGAAIPLTGPLTSLHLGFDPEEVGYAYAPDRARALVDAAGLSTPLSITLDVPTTLPDEALELARRMVESYDRIGIDARVVEHDDRPAYAEMVRSKRIHDAACFDSSPLSTFRIMREKFHSGFRGPWWLGYDNHEVNRLIDKARSTPSFKIRQKLYQRAYRRISRDAPWIFLYNPIRYVGVADRLSGWHPTPEGLIGFS